MEVETELDLHQKVVDFIVLKKPELLNSKIHLNVIGEEYPSIFLILVEVNNNGGMTDQITPMCGIILYECSFHREAPRSNPNISFIFELRKKNDITQNDKDEICYATLSSDKKFLGITLQGNEIEDKSYWSYIINISTLGQKSEIVKLHLSPPFKELCKIQFIQTPMNTIRSKSPLTRKSMFANMQSTHILFSVEKTFIKYQRVLMSPKLALVENENILSRKLYFYEIKSDLERLYILETSSHGAFNLKSFQIIWPHTEEKVIQTYEFQQLFSYQIYLPSQQVDSFPINSRVLEHSNGSICFCYELRKGQREDSSSRYYYCVHLIHANNIIECRTPAFVANNPGKVLFTIYKCYIVIFTKHFIHLIDIYCHSKQTCSYIWPTCFEEKHFSNLKTLNALKLSKIYFLQETNFVLSVKPNLHRIATMIKDSNSVTQKVGALNFIVYNHFRNNNKNVSQFAIECIIYAVNNSFTMSRLMEEYITASVHRYLRVKDTEERFIKYIDNTTLSGQFSSKLLGSINSEDPFLEEDLIKVNIKLINNDALVVFVKDNLPNPQINRFLRLSSTHDYKTKKDSNNQPSKIELVFENHGFSDEPNLPPYLVNLSLNKEQIQEMDAIISQKVFNNRKAIDDNIQSFVEKIRICTIRAWKKLLFLIHKATFEEEDNLWESMCLLKGIKNEKITYFHIAIGAFRYVLLKEKVPVPFSIDEMYMITSFNVLSTERFLVYLTYSNFFSITSVFMDFFIQFYQRFLADSGNILLIKIKDKMLYKMTISTEMELLRVLNADDQAQVIREYWDSINSNGANVFNKYYNEVMHSISGSCDTPQNSLLQFYKQTIKKVQLDGRPEF